MLKKLLVFTLLTTAAFSVFSQQQSEDKLIERADELFSEQKYAEAFPVYSQLVSLHPQSPIFNFKFGASAVYTGDGQTTSIKHLSFAIKKGVKNPLAHYFLGRAYHLNYEFEDAIDSYQDFRQKADKDLLEEFEVESLIEQCEFGKNLLSGIKEVVVLEKTEASIDDYFRYYNLEKIGGRMLATPDELLSRIDKKKNYQSTIHYSGSETAVYFPSYGKDEDTGTDIYRAYLLPDGKWSNPELLHGFVNTQQDEDFAFFHPDGKTLYFASKGHNSMGGFDIFKSTYNAGDDSFGPPENMDFAVNTPADDVFYVVDKNKETAYFSSDRTSSQDKLHVYKVKVKTIPLNVVVIDGDYISEIAPSEKEVTIRVLASSDKRLITTVSSDDITGEYSISFERPGNYILEVESPGSPYIHEAEMRIPEFDKPVLLSQKMRLVEENGAEKLIVDNIFDNPKDLDLADVSLDVIRQKAGLDVNATDELISAAENKTDQNASPAVLAGFTEGTTAEDVVLKMDEESAELAEMAAEESDKSLSLIALAENKKERSDSLLNEVSAVRAQLNKEDKEKYLKDLARLNELMSEVKKLNVEAAAAIQLSEKSEVYAEQLEAQSNEISQRSEATQSAIAEGNEEGLIKLLQAEHSHQRSTKEEQQSPGMIAAKEKSEKERESRELYEDVETLKSDARSVMRNLQVMRDREAATTGRKDKEEVQMRVSQLETEFEMLKSDIDRKREQANEAVDEANLAGAKAFIYSNSEEWDAGTPKPESATNAKSQRVQISTELVSIEERTAELDFNDEESMVLASDEMKFTRNDIKEEELLADYRPTAPIELKKSSDFRDEFTSLSEEFYSNRNGVEVSEQSEELSTELDQHIDFWQKELESAPNEKKADIKDQLSDLKLTRTELKVLAQSAGEELAQNQPEQESSSSENETSDNADQRSSEATDRQSQTGDNPSMDDDSLEEQTSTESSESMAVANESETADSSTENTNGDSRAEETETSGQESQTSTGGRETGGAIPNSESVENDRVKSLAEQLPNAESLADYDSQSQQLIQLDNELREQIEEEDSQSAIDSLEEARNEVKMVQFDLNTLDQLYLAELNEIQQQNTSEQLKSRQEIELNRKFAQLIDKKKFQLDSYKSQNEEMPFSAQAINQELENRKYKAMTRMNGLRTELDGGKDAEPNRLAENTDTPEQRSEEETTETVSETAENNAPEERSASDTDAAATEPEEKSAPLNSNTDETTTISLVNEFAEPTSTDVESAYQSDVFAEMYSTQAGVNLRFRNEDDIEKHRKEISEYQTKFDNGDESTRTLRKLDNARMDLAEEEARNGTKVRRMVEQTIEEYNDVISSQKRISNESLSETENEYVEILDEVATVNLSKADSLRGVAINVSDPNEQNKLFKKAYVYESRAIESKKAIAEMYESGDWNEDLVALNTTSDLADDSKPEDEPDQEPTTNRTEETTEQPEEVVSGTETEEIPERLAENSPSPDQIENEDESSLGLPEAEPEEVLVEEGEIFSAQDESEARSMVSATVNQREAFEEELSQAEFEQLQDEPQYAEYNEQVQEVLEQQKELSNKLSELQQKKRAYSEVNTEIDLLEEELATTTDEDRKSEIEEELTRLRVQAEVKYKEVREQREKTSQQATMLDVAIVEANTDYRELISGVRNRTATSLSKATAAELARFEMPKKLNQNVFARSESSVYSEENPIPEVTEMPDGIVYQVQVGAFRNPIPQDHFREFAPVMAHNLNNGITRYTVGLFNQLTVAQGTRDQVREMGYSDAFVVAYRNGERISIDVARANEEQPSEEARVADNQPKAEPTPIAETAGLPGSGAPVAATTVADIDGVFFTVQVGVFSKPVSQGDLKVNQLNVDRTASGMKRYTTGVFGDYQSADQRKEQVRNNGIPDAFVTAYYNGQRISVNRAQQLMDEGAGTAESEKEQQQFIVFIGRFENQVPSDVARAMLMLEGRYGVVQESKENYTDYYTKPVNSRLEAERIQAAFSEFEVEGTEIRPVSGGK
jgi:hypothetical protein